MKLAGRLGVVVALCLLPGLEVIGQQANFEESPRVRFRVVAEIGIESATDERQRPYQFSSIRDADFDDEGNIYALDSKDVCVKVFDGTGKFRRTILRQGQGPNEIENPYRIRIRRSDRRLFVLHQHGFQLKEFDELGQEIRSYSLPEQVFGFFEFIGEKRVLYVAARKFGERGYNNLKILNLDSGKLEKELAPRAEDLFIGFQRWVHRDGVIWTCPGDHTALEAWSMGSGEALRTIPLPGKYLPFQTIRWGESIQKMRVFSYAQPFPIGQELFVFVTRQTFSEKPQDMFDRPLTRTVTVYRLENDGLVAAAEFPSFDFYVDIHASRRNRILISSSGYDAFPRIKVLEIEGK
jgi:hypothetical protein